MGTTPSPSQNRRTHLWRLLSDEPGLRMAPQDKGQLLLHNLLRPRIRRVYVEAARPWPEDSEDLVHDLRVASRRLVEALALLRPLIGKAECKAAQTAAKALRQALGAQREADVRVQDLQHLALKAGLNEATVKGLESLRVITQEGLQAPQDLYPPERLLGLALDVMGLTPKEDRDLSWSQLLADHLQRRLRRTEPLLMSLKDPKQVQAHHAMRIGCKHLRYTLEITGQVFVDLPVSAPLRALKHLQDVLGELNDAQDLRLWLQGPDLTRAVGKGPAAKICAAADRERARRYEAARDRCLDEGPQLFESVRGLCKTLTNPGHEKR